MKTFLLLVFSALVAFFFAPWLSIFIPFPTIHMISDAGTLVFARIVVWTVLLYLVFRYSGRVLWSKKPKQFAETKLSRRIRGFMAESFLFFFLAFAIMLIPTILAIDTKPTAKLEQIAFENAKIVLAGQREMRERQAIASAPVNIKGYFTEKELPIVKRIIDLEKYKIVPGFTWETNPTEYKNRSFDLSLYDGRQSIDYYSKFQSDDGYLVPRDKRLTLYVKHPNLDRSAKISRRLVERFGGTPKDKSAYYSSFPYQTALKYQKVRKEVKTQIHQEVYKVAPQIDLANDLLTNFGYPLIPQPEDFETEYNPFINIAEDYAMMVKPEPEPEDERISIYDTPAEKFHDELINPNRIIAAEWIPKDQYNEIVDNYGVWSNSPAILGRAIGSHMLFTLPLTILLFYIGRVRYKAVVSKELSKMFSWFESSYWGLGGSGGFANQKTEWGNQYPMQKESIFAGYSMYSPDTQIGIPGQSHFMTIAPSRSGKGITCIIPNCLLWEGSLCVIDPKGEAAIISARRRREMGQEVNILDPFNLVRNKGVDMPTVTMDILSQIKPTSDSFSSEVKALADALVIAPAGELQPFFNNGARDLIVGAIAHMITSDDYPNPSLCDLPAFYGFSSEDRRMLMRDMLANDGARGLTQKVPRLLARADTQGGGGIDGIFSSYYEHVGWLEEDPFPDFLTSRPDKPNFDFRSLKNNPSSVFFIIKEVGDFKRLIRLFLNYASRVITEGNRSPHPILMIIDEFLSLDKMPQIKRAFTEFAGYGLICWPIIQDLSGLQGIYGKDGAQSFIGNTRAVQVFAAKDGVTQEFLLQNFDKRDMSIVSDLNKFSNFQPLRTAPETRMETRAETGKQYIVWDKKPMLLMRKAYFQDKNFNGLWNEHPDYKKS